MPLRFKFPLHFQERMQERGIQIEHVRITINKPDFTEKTFQGRIRVRKKIDENRVIEVIYFKDGFRDANDIVIITAYYIKS